MNARISQIRNAINEKALVIGLAVTAPALSFAQSTDPFAAVVTDVTAKVTTYAGALVGVAAVGVAFMVAVKYVKKIRGAA